MHVAPLCCVDGNVASGAQISSIPQCRHARDTAVGRDSRQVRWCGMDDICEFSDDLYCIQACFWCFTSDVGSLRHDPRVIIQSEQRLTLIYYCDAAAGARCLCASGSTQQIQRDSRLAQNDVLTTPLLSSVVTGTIENRCGSTIFVLFGYTHRTGHLRELSANVWQSHHTTPIHHTTPHQPFITTSHHTTSHHITSASHHHTQGLAVFFFLRSVYFSPLFSTKHRLPMCMDGTRARVCGWDMC